MASEMPERLTNITPAEFLSLWVKDELAWAINQQVGRELDSNTSIESLYYYKTLETPLAWREMMEDLDRLGKFLVRQVTGYTFRSGLIESVGAYRETPITELLEIPNFGIRRVCFGKIMFDNSSDPSNQLKSELSQFQKRSQRVGSGMGVGLGPPAGGWVGLGQTF